jgi:hypothetical protein
MGRLLLAHAQVKVAQQTQVRRLLVLPKARAGTRAAARAPGVLLQQAASAIGGFATHSHRCSSTVYITAKANAGKAQNLSFNEWKVTNLQCKKRVR